MKIIATIIFGFVCVTAVIYAIPPPPTTRTALAKRSDVIVIVTITNVTDHVSIEDAWKQGTQQRALAIVERTIKGSVPRTLRLIHDGPPLGEVCRPPPLFKGHFLLFLRRQGDGFVRSDNWYSQATIATNHVNFPMEQAVDLKTALRELERIVQSK